MIALLLATTIVPTNLHALVERSDLIVVAEVIREGPIAEARVIETWKGDPGETVEFVATPAFMCDVSTTFCGDRALWFFHESEAFGGIRISHHGYGRMPWSDRGGSQTFLAYAGQVRIPSALRTAIGRGEYRRVHAGDLREYVLSQMALESAVPPQATPEWLVRLGAVLLVLLAAGYLWSERTHSLQALASEG